MNPELHQLVSIHGEISRRQEELDSLRLHVQQLEAQTQTYRALLAPLRRGLIPHEILAEIFRDVVSMVEDHRKVSEQVITICLVCKNWREVAVATPHLWTDLQVSLVQKQDTLNRVQLWVDRAGWMPKKLWISGICGAHRAPLGQGCPLKNTGLARVLATTPSIEELSLECNNMGCFQTLICELMSPLLQRVPRPWSCLKSFGIKVAQQESDAEEYEEEDREKKGKEDELEETAEDAAAEEEEDEESEEGEEQEEEESREDHFFSHIPASASLLLSFPDCDYGFEDHPPINLADTTKITLLGGWGVQWVLESLETGKNLVDVTLDLRQCWYLEAATNVDCALPHLKILRMRRMLYSTHTDEMEIFYRITMPALETLDLSFYDWTSDNDHPHAPRQLAQRIGDSLQSLSTRALGQFRLQHLRLHSIGPLPFSEYDLKRIFLPIPSLVHLTLDDVAFASKFFTTNASTNRILPNLNRLEILNIDTKQESFRVSELYPFIDRRVDPGRPGAVLEKVILTVQRLDRLDQDYQLAQRKLASLGEFGRVMMVDELDCSDSELYGA